VRPSKRIQEAAARFLDKDFIPRIEKRGTEQHPMHEAGWSLAYHGKSRIGQLVRASKYEDGGPFALGLVYDVAELVRTRYPVETINAIVSVPPTKSGLLVENFARQVAAKLGIEYIPAVAKVRLTEEQKNFTNWRQKAENVKGAFCVHSPELIAGRTLLLIDDIYDSGYMLREVGKTLMQAGAKAVYPLTITRTAHSDDQ
jgi:ATP-dependent DNA helicase RecQ